MKKVYILGKVRGFFRNLLTMDCQEVSFFGDQGYYEAKRVSRRLIALRHTKFVGFWGLFTVVSPKETATNYDCYLSYNRFARSRKPYLIYLENPTALCNYSLACLDSPFVKKKLRRWLDDPSLRKIICMSKACEKTLEQVLGVAVPKEKLTQIYPYVPKNQLVTPEQIQARCSSDAIKLLYIAQGSRFYSKGGKEVIRCFAKLRESFDLTLTMITNIDMLDVTTIEEIHRLGIELVDFKLDSQQMQQVYADHTLLLQPSSDDSFGLTVLEAMKAGLPVIASDLYAFREMVTHGENGFLLKPSYRLFDMQDLPDPVIWNHREKTIYAKIFDPALADALAASVRMLCQDRALLYRMSLSSHQRAETVFSEAVLAAQWDAVTRELEQV